MKRLVSVMFAAVLIISLLSVPAFAVGTLPMPNEYYAGNDYTIYSDPNMLPLPDVFNDQNSFNGSYSVSGSVLPPHIISTSGSVQAAAGGVPAALRVDAYSPQGASLGYQWYYYDTGYGLSMIPGATGYSYTPDCHYGSQSYCVGVYSVMNGMRSEEVMSDVMSVTYTGVSIVSAPTRTNYYVGDNVDLSGLVVRVYDGSGTYWTSYNGNGLSVYPTAFSTAGRAAVEVSDGYSSDVFYVNIGTEAQGRAANHAHTFGDWEITKEATCVTTGVRSRSCTCGETETEEILKTEHSWDEGTITKQATSANNGSRLYTCTICQANRSEIIPAGTQAPSPTTSLDAAAAANPNVVINQGNPAGSTYNNSGNNTYSNFNNQNGASPYVGTQTNPAQGSVDGSNTGAGAFDASQMGQVTKNRESSGWWLIPVSAVVLVGTGIGAYYLMQKKGGGE